MDDDALFERIAASSDPSGPPEESAPAKLQDKIHASLIARQRDDSAFETLAAGEVTEAASPSLKSRIYSALVTRQAESGPLLGLAAVKADGRGLCVFEELVNSAPAGGKIKEKTQSSNCCRICHARLLAEHMNSAPIYWRHCPYVGFQRR